MDGTVISPIKVFVHICFSSKTKIILNKPFMFSKDLKISYMKIIRRKKLVISAFNAENFMKIGKGMTSGERAYYTDFTDG
jgi:hypothetical protein